MTQSDKKQIHPVQRTRRYRDLKALLASIGPASAIVRRMAEEHGITLSLRAVYNWPRRGVSEDAAPAIAALAKRPVEEVLRLSGKL